jgi:hypothetical protein
MEHNQLMLTATPHLFTDVSGRISMKMSSFRGGS